jgi:hypothetical protein
VSLRNDTPHNSAVLARDQVEIGLTENRGDSAQDGWAFQVKGIAFGEFKGLQKELSGFDIEKHEGVQWQVFYVVARTALAIGSARRAPRAALPCRSHGDACSRGPSLVQAAINASTLSK